jgi:hypothetical protein
VAHLRWRPTRQKAVTVKSASTDLHPTVEPSSTRAVKLQVAQETYVTRPDAASPVQGSDAPMAWAASMRTSS